jgi:hypothetical protein
MNHDDLANYRQTTLESMLLERVKNQTLFDHIMMGNDQVSHLLYMARWIRVRILFRLPSLPVTLE